MKWGQQIWCMLRIQECFGTTLGPQQVWPSCLKNWNQRFWANRGLASSPTLRVSRNGKTTPQSVGEDWQDSLTCCDFLMERKHFSKLQHGPVVLPILSPLANPHPHWPLPLFLEIPLSSSVETGDVLLGFEEPSTRGVGQANSRKAKEWQR